jgi:predicted nucleic acid-binding protein
VIVADTSVVVAGFASWHEFHEPARRILDRGARLPAQAALESYSVLTRLPAPHRAAAALVQEFLAGRFRSPCLMLHPPEFREFLAELPPLGIVGGAAYDALIAAVARDAGATLVTCDRRAADVYERLGSDVEYIM